MKEKKRCSIKECDNPVFGKGKCLYHRRMDYKPVRRTQIKQKVYTIPKVSKSQERKEKLYEQAKKEKEIELKKAKKWKCIFCGKSMKYVIWHHGLGRTGKLMYNKKYLYPAHIECHNDYHRKEMNKLIWWDDYIKRIKNENPEIYEKELYRESKSNRENSSQQY